MARGNEVLSMKIAVSGMRYVGFSNAVLLAQNNAATAIDTNANRASLINSGKSPIEDRELEEYLSAHDLFGSD